MKQSPPACSAWKRWRRRAKWAVRLFVVVALLFAITPLDEWLAAKVISRIAGVELSIGSLTWPPFGSLRATEVAARLPGATEPFFTANRVTLELGLFPPRLARIVLTKPRVVATEPPSLPGSAFR